MSRPTRTGRLVAAAAAFAAACDPAEPAPLPPNSFAFGVFGDGPYRSWESARFRRVIADANRADLRWFVHVGDLLWFPCSDAALSGRLARLNAIRHPVVYTPGDNEWADCHASIAGRFRPLDRLDFIRRTFFARPRQSIGGHPMPVETQADDPAWSEFVENAGWRFGGFAFATLHVVGSGNGSVGFPGRAPADEEEVGRRSAAAIAWLDATFAAAAAEAASGVVLIMHADPGFDLAPAERPAYQPLISRLEHHVSGFGRPVLLIHGDSHQYRVDHPLQRGATGDTLANFIRLETFGAPDIGWVRVVVDSVAGRVVGYEPRLMAKRLFW
jgi:hypothetical protein